MSRLSKFIRGKNIKIGPIVQYLVKLAEILFGGGEGAAKKKLVADLIAAILKRAEAAGSKTPESSPAIVDELIDQTVDVYNEVGWPEETSSNGSFGSAPKTFVDVDVPIAAPKRRGRKPGTKIVNTVVPQLDPDDDFDLTDIKFDDED